MHATGVDEFETRTELTQDIQQYLLKRKSSPQGVRISVYNGSFAEKAWAQLFASEKISTILSADDYKKIVDIALYATGKIPSAFRLRNAPMRVHVAVIDTLGNYVIVSQSDAWAASWEIAIAKAKTAMSYSSNENAWSTRTVHPLAQESKPLSGIEHVNEPTIVFPGGFPLYRNGTLIGGVGVSGDSVSNDETAAFAAAISYAPPPAIRSGVYVLAAVEQEARKIEQEWRRRR